MHTTSSSAGLDLVYNGGPTVRSAVAYNILVNCPAGDESCWGGAMATFENDLTGSQMIHISDQYVNAAAPNRYAYGGDVQVQYQYDPASTLEDQDIYNIVYAVAQQLGTGYNAIYHVFLPPGAQQCSQQAGGCYGPGGYCAYHANADFDIGHTLFSVEPFQGVTGCEVTDAHSPNGVVADSTASTLSHETFETITDPDVGSNPAWNNASTGQEIGDLCSPADGIPTSVVQLSQYSWEIQSEYDDNVHDCSYAP